MPACRHAAWFLHTGAWSYCFVCIAMHFYWCCQNDQTEWFPMKTDNLHGSFVRCCWIPSPKWYRLCMEGVAGIGARWPQPDSVWCSSSMPEIGECIRVYIQFKCIHMYMCNRFPFGCRIVRPRKMHWDTKINVAWRNPGGIRVQWVSCQVKQHRSSEAA